MDIRKIYDYALSREVEGKRFFEENASRLSHSAAVGAFKRLAEEEQRHIEFIQLQISSLENSGTVETTPPQHTGEAEYFTQRAVSESIDQTVYESEIYQNCNVFNDGAFFQFTEKDTKDDSVVFIEHGKPLVFGKEHNKGIRLYGFTPEVVSLADEKYSVNDLLVHNETDTTLSFILADMTYKSHLPRPVGIFLANDRPCYDEEMTKQIETSRQKRGDGDMKKLLNSGETWVIN